MTELEELHLLACSPESEAACGAAARLGELGADDPQSIELLIGLLSSDLSHDSQIIKIGEDYAKVSVRVAAANAIKQIGGKAVDAVLERIATPRSPADELLLERTAVIGRPLFDLARILVTDGDLRRSRAAEPIVAEFADELGVDEAIGIYLAVADRERFAPRGTPWILHAIWPRFRTAEARAAVADRWIERELRDWIEGRLDRDPMAACVLNALLIAGPEDATPILQRSLVSFTSSARWMAIESMLRIDPVRTGQVIAGIDPLWGWARGRIRYGGYGELELRMLIACSRAPEATEQVLKSYEFQTNTQSVITVMQTLRYEDACAWRDQLRKAADQRRDTRTTAAMQRVLDAFPL